VSGGGSTVSTIQSGGFVELVLLTNSVAAGTWDTHYLAPSNTSWSTNTLSYPGAITSLTGLTLASGNVAVSSGSVNVTEVAGTSAVTLTGATQTTSNPVLNMTQTWNAAAIAITGSSGTGSVATLTFATQPTALPIGSTISVTGVSSLYNGIYVVTASTTTSVSYACIATGSFTSGTVQLVMTGALLNITNTASSGYSALMDLQIGGASKFKVINTSSSTLIALPLSGGGISAFTTPYGFSNCPSFSWIANGSATLSSTNNPLTLSDNYAGVNAAIVLRLAQGAYTQYLTVIGNASLQLGSPNAASPVAQTLSVQSVVAGTSNTAGANFTINGSQGTGTGVGGDIIFQVAPAGSTGTTQNALATALRVYNNKTVFVGAGFTVSGLPAAGTAGRRAYVTDLNTSTPTFLATLTGGGSNVCPVFDNGTAWVAG
jgi:hypothetical protein